MRATRAFEIASYLTLGSVVALFVTLSLLNWRMIDRVAQQDAEIHGAYGAMVLTANLAAELAEIQRDESRLPWPGTADSQPVAAVSAARRTGVHSNPQGRGIDPRWQPQLQCLGEAVHALRPQPPAGVTLAALGGFGFQAPANEPGDERLSPGEITTLLDDMMQRQWLAVENGVLAESHGFRRLQHDAILIGVIATVPGLLLFALIRRSFAAQREVAGQLAFANDHLEQKVSERTADLQAANVALSQHSARIEAAREEERLRIARDVHDELGSTLTALKFELAAGKPRGARGAEGERRSWSRRASTDLVDAALQSVQNVMAALRPFPFEQLGLGEALRWKAGQFEQLLCIPCRLSMAQELPRLAPAVATAAFRIVEEALTNVARHAGASAVDLVVRIERERLVLEIADDGRGIAREALSEPRSFGLLSMRERARSVGGEVQFVGCPGRGTTVRLSLPLTDDEGAWAGSGC